MPAIGANRLIVAAVVLLAIGATGAGVAIGGKSGATSGPDRITGTERGDKINGRGGGDRIFGKGGRDQLRGAGGDDRLFGGPASDKLIGGRGRDILRGGAGTDKFRGGKARDGFSVRDGVRFGSGGNDVLNARDGKADEINCGAGFDKVFVDEVEDGVYNCEKIIGPGGQEIGGQGGSE